MTGDALAASAAAAEQAADTLIGSNEGWGSGGEDSADEQGRSPQRSPQQAGGEGGRFLDGSVGEWTESGMGQWSAADDGATEGGAISPPPPARLASVSVRAGFGPGCELELNYSLAYSARSAAGGSLRTAAGLDPSDQHLHRHSSYASDPSSPSPKWGCSSPSWRHVPSSPEPDTGNSPSSPIKRLGAASSPTSAASRRAARALKNAERRAWGRVSARGTISQAAASYLTQSAAGVVVALPSPPREEISGWDGGTSGWDAPDVSTPSPQMDGRDAHAGGITAPPVSSPQQRQFGRGGKLLAEPTLLGPAVRHTRISGQVALTMLVIDQEGMESSNVDAEYAGSELELAHKQAVQEKYIEAARKVQRKYAKAKKGQRISPNREL